MASSSQPRTKRVVRRHTSDNLQTLYKTKEKRDIFNKEWVPRAIHPMRGLDFEAVDPIYREIFEFQHLVPVLSSDFLLFPEPTLLFYLHLERWDRNNVRGIKTYLYGEEIVITEDDVVEICGGLKFGWSASRSDSLHRFLLEIEPQHRRPDSEVATLLTGNANLPLKRITLVRQLCPLARNLEKLVRDNLVPKHGDKTSLTGATKILLYCLLARVPIAFPKLIFDNMLDIKKIGGRAVGYGQLITWIMSRKGVVFLDNSVYHGLKRKYDRTEFDQARPQQMGSDDEAQEAAEAEEIPEPEPQAVESSFGTAQWEQLGVGIASIQSSLEGLGNTVTRHGHQMHAMSHFLKKLGNQAGVKPSKGFNRLLRIDPASTARYAPQVDDDDDESPPAASRGSEGDGGEARASGDDGGEDITDLNW